jgi:hypothetical protein
MLAAAGDPIGTPTPRADGDLNHVGPRQTRLQGSAHVSQPLRAVIRRRDDDPAVGAQHRDHVHAVYQVIWMMLWCRFGEMRDFWAALS